VIVRFYQLFLFMIESTRRKTAQTRIQKKKKEKILKEKKENKKV